MIPRHKMFRLQISLFRGFSKEAIPYIGNIQIEVLQVSLISFLKKELIPVHKTSIHHPNNPHFTNSMFKIFTPYYC